MRNFLTGFVLPLLLLTASLLNWSVISLVDLLAFLALQYTAPKTDEWWRNFGIDDLELQTLAIRILSQTCSSSGCERNWSVFERIHTKRRNRLEHKRLNDLVYTHYNLRLKERQASRKSLTDPISLENIDLTDDWVVEAEDDDAPLLDVDDIDDWMDVADAILDEGEGGAAAGFRFRRASWVSVPIIIFSFLVVISQAVFHAIWFIEGKEWKMADTWWAQLIGFVRFQPQRSMMPLVYFLVIQIGTALVASFEVFHHDFSRVPWQTSRLESFFSSFAPLGSHLRVACCLLLPALQLVVGISHPSWVSLPFFLGSCVGLVEWSLTSNFLGLFRWWRPLLVYAAFNIIFIYIYQLPIKFPKTVQVAADFIGFYKASTNSEWPEISSGLSLLVFYFMLSTVKSDLEEMSLIMAMPESSLREQLLPSKHSFFIRESRSGVKHTNVLLKGAIFRNFSINFFTYGFPVLLLALSFWCFNFASICAFGLLAYVGYVLYAFPSLFHLHRLNGLLLVFILLWAMSTYVFNVAFTFLNKKLRKDMEIWETVGLWHYPIPGFFLLAQFCLGVLVAVGNLVNNSVFLYLSDEDAESSDGDTTVVEKEDTKVVIVATIAWGLSKSSRAITLFLIFLLAIKPGFIHAVYSFFLNPRFQYEEGFVYSDNIRSGVTKVIERLAPNVTFAIEATREIAQFRGKIGRFGDLTAQTAVGIMNPVIFFFAYLLSHTVSRKVRRFLILLCEAHFALLYILQLNMISKALENKGSIIMEILSQLGLLDHASSWDFLKIAALLSFCAIQTHGLDMLVSFSAIVRHTHYAPFGFSILKEGLNKSVLLSVYASPNARENHLHRFSHENWIATYLSAIGQKFLSTYRSYGTYIAFLTIFLTVYLVTPNYISFGYLFFLMFWIIGRQLVEKTKRRLWVPLKVYAILVFVFTYSLSVFPRFKTWVSTMTNLYPELGYNPKASLLENIWQSLAILIVMQLYSYERRQSRDKEKSDDFDPPELGVLGFIRRFLIWHSEKILSVAVFYASLSPISVFGFLYLLALVACSILPKVSRIPSKLFLVYTGLLVTSEYLFQMWGKQAKMFPGQKYSDLSKCLGLQLFGTGFWGLESGLRGKILVIVACTLQYNVFHWLAKMPSSMINTGKWEEPCHLFVSKEKHVKACLICPEEIKPSMDQNLLSVRRRESSNSCPSLSSGLFQDPNLVPVERSSESNSSRYSFGYFWGSSKESHKWNKKRILALRTERFELQKTTLKVYMKFWMENVFNLRGLEINMIALLLASFSLLNVISLLYIAALVACILINRQILRKLWPIFFFLFASILTLEYLAIWKNLLPWNQKVPAEEDVCCHGCWSNSNIYFDYCKKCWLGIVVDDPRMLVSYYLVVIFASFKLRSDHLARFSESHTYRQMMSQRNNALVWKDFSFETKSLWTLFDYLRLYFYCHLLDVVLVLILITGTLEYDILHLGYLAFALVFFRIRLDILKKKNKIFKFLRMYNFILIVLSLAYQSPFLGDSKSGKCDTIDYIYEIIGFYKYDYGFRITSRSALVEIIIFMLASVQSHIFRSKEFEYVSRYLEAEQIGAIVKEQEKKAAWKTEQLQHIRKSEERKRKQNLQVEKMKAEMLNLQSQLNNINPDNEVVRQKNSSEHVDKATMLPDKDEKQDPHDNTDSPVPSEIHDVPESCLEPIEHSVGSFCEITEIEGKPASLFANPDQKVKQKGQAKENPLLSAVQLIGDSVSQVQSLGNQAVTNIVSFLKIEHEESDSNEHSSAEDVGFDEAGTLNHMDFGEYEDNMSSTRSTGDLARPQIRKIFRHIWTKMRSNNDVVCYCCFVLVFLWNFSLLSMVYLAALFLYALCVNSGPTYLFWVIMLIYTEINILAQYLYQIIIQHCGVSFHSDLLWRLGFPADKIISSFVISTLPLFMVYITTLLQSSITATDGEWSSVDEFKFLRQRILYREEIHLSFGWRERVKRILLPVTNIAKVIIRGFVRYWKSLTCGSEAPPYFVQLSMRVDAWPEDGIQPERIESGINKLLEANHNQKCKEISLTSCHSCSRVRVQSIESNPENPNIAIAVFEVVYASPLDGCPPTEWYKSLTPAADVAVEILKAQSEGLVKELGFPYQIVSVIGGGKREIDLYAYIFGADLAAFFLVAMFYQSVIKNNSKFLDVYQLDDQFPKEFVFILMILFFLIVLDRIIYLCAFATGKVIFYLFNLVLFTYSVTKYAWYTEHGNQDQRTGGFALRAIYLTKAISLALQALQIKYGIPRESTLYRQFLTSKVSQINLLGFRLYRAVPFLYELRCVLDWSCTTTSLTMYDWLKLEDIHASLYLVKCDADLNRATHKLGQKQTKMTKFCSGICLFFVLICVIWAPMLMYSSGNPTNIANPIKDVSVQIDIITAGGRLTLYQTTLCEKLPWEDLEQNSELDPQGYLDMYNVKDIQLICCQSDASFLWLVPHVVQTKFMLSLDQNMEIIFSWVLTRDRPKGKEVVKFGPPVPIPPDPSAVKDVLNETIDSVRIWNVYPRYFRVTGSGEVRLLEQQVDQVNGDLILNRVSPPWWSFHDINASEMQGCGGLTGPIAVVISEETPQGILGETLSKFSIWSLYITFVLAVGRFIRLQCSDLRMRIPYENLPSCDRLIAICENIYAARAEGELEVEEVLYWTLVKIYRSPHMLLEYTKQE